jgi:mono/diheme cytochrome c family protein
VILAAAAVGAVLLALKLPESPDNARHGVHMPLLSELGRKGKAAFDRKCAECHGQNGSGSDKGPTLIHRVYHPGHHGDAVFALAIKVGARQHHWRFGDMPAQSKVTDEQVAAIIRFVREVQIANGIGSQ